MAETFTPIWNEGNTDNSIKNALSVAASGNDETTELSLSDLTGDAVLSGSDTVAGKERTDLMGLLIGAIVGATDPDGDITVDIFRGIEKDGAPGNGIVYESVVDSTLTFPIVIIGKPNTTQNIYIVIVETPHIKIKLTNAATNTAITFDIDTANRVWRQGLNLHGSIL